MRLEPYHPDQPRNPVAGDATLDDILAMNAARDPDGPALSGLAGVATWRDADSAASRLAAVFAGWGLGEDATVGVQLGSSPEGALTCLALWRAGLIPALLPLPWRRREVAAALASVGATAIVAHTTGGGAELAQIGCEVAAGLDAIRFVGCFGAAPPDGATPLDHAIAGEEEAEDAPAFRREERPEDAADHVAVVTFEAGGAPVPRSHNDVLAAGLAPLIACKLLSGSALLSTLDLGGLAGLATGLAPWLTTGCEAAFHQASTTGALARAAQELGATHVALPGRAAARIAADGALHELERPTVATVWRAPDGRGAAEEPHGAGAIVDVVAFGELGLFAAPRTTPGRHAPLPLGPAGPKGFSALLELRVSPEGRLALRGPACPQAPCPADPAVPALAFDADGFLDSGLTAVADRLSQRVSLGGRRRGIVQVGGLALAAADVEAAFRSVGVDGRPTPQDERTFGFRLAIADPDAALRAKAALDEAGFGPALAPVALAVEPALKSA